MTIRTLLLLGAGSLVGCSAADLSKPLFTSNPPEPAAKKDADRARSDERAKAPISPSQVSDRNADRILSDLEAELSAAGK
ncbi:MAG: hypothetical protein K1X57_13380 [Gemmataceae bacterium]|nr:hypothetical protein [Gemmataceae bacterium]